MSLRIKLLTLFTLTVTAAVSVMVWGVERYAQRQFQESDQQRSAALAAQFQRELLQRGAEVSNSVQSIVDAESTLRMVLELSRPQADPSVYVHDARGLAAPRRLDFLELVNVDGTLISSAQWPERIGYKNDWVTQRTDWNQQNAFLDRVELSNRVELGLLAVRMVPVGDRNFYIIGGQRLDSEFLHTLALPSGMRALLYRNFEESFAPAALSDADGPLADAQPFEPIIASLKASLKQQPQGSEQTMHWTAEQGSAERFVTLPLTGRRGEFLGALLLGSAQGQLIALVNYIRGLGLVVAAAGVFLGFALSWWISARVTGPLARLASGIDDVAAGDWDTQVQVRSSKEVKRAVRAFNQMTSALVETRSGQLARERVSAWRELAKHTAAELSASLLPLQIVIENLGQARQRAPKRFDEVDIGSLAALQEELRVLQSEARRLDEFAVTPELHLQAIDINETVRAAVKFFEPLFRPSGRPPVTPELFLDAALGSIRADPGLLQTAVENLLHVALADMPAGGTLTIRTRQQDGMARMMISDTGRGFELRGEGRIFSPFLAARGAGEGLGFATVQAIVSDHGGRISMESAPGAGTTFYLDLPIVSAGPPLPPSSRAQAALLKPPARMPDVPPVAVATAAEIPEPATELPVEVQPEVALEAQAPVELPLEIPSEGTPPEEPEVAAETAPQAPAEEIEAERAAMVPLEFAEEETFRTEMEAALEEAFPSPTQPDQAREEPAEAIEAEITAEVPLEIAEDIMLQAELEEVSQSAPAEESTEAGAETEDRESAAREAVEAEMAPQVRLAVAEEEVLHVELEAVSAASQSQAEAGEHAELVEVAAEPEPSGSTPVENHEAVQPPAAPEESLQELEKKLEAAPAETQRQREWFPLTYR